MIRAIKQWLLKKEMSGKLEIARRNRRFHNMETAKTFGVLFDASTEASYNKVSGFIRYLQSKNKTVKAIGYVEYKVLPHYIVPLISYDYILKKDLSFANKPNAGFVKDFLSQEFDVLIDFNINKLPSLVYIMALSPANFKIGLYDDELKQYYDFMIKGIQQDHLGTFIKQSLEYLENLNTSI